VSLLTQILVPSVALALTGGPTQPEFTSFESVNASNLVNEFTGDFMYNIPLLEVPGPHGSSYPVTLSYHSGITSEQEASWVGLGWTLNTGAVTRNKRGFADDFKNADVIYHNDRPDNWTITAGASIGSSEIFGFDLGPVSASVNSSIRYNNYAGFGYNRGIGINLNKGLVSLGLNDDSHGPASFSLNVNPAALLNKQVQRKIENLPITQASIANNSYRTFSQHTNVSLVGSNYGIFSAGEAESPVYVANYTGQSHNFTLGIETDPVYVPAGFTGNVSGSFSIQRNERSTQLKSNGYLYTGNQKMLGNDGKELDYVLDYGIRQDNSYNKRDVFIGVPFNNADHFVVTGEGISGGFQLHHQSIGHFQPYSKENNTRIINVGGEMRLPGTVGPGLDVGVGSHTLSEGGWENSLPEFGSADPENFNNDVFFRFNNDLGGQWLLDKNDGALSADLHGRNLSVTKVPAFMNDGKRSGRSSYIDFHTNEQIHKATRDGATLSKYEVYTLDANINAQAGRASALHKDLIGEVSVFNEAGYHYVYGLPVYSRDESSISYAVTGTAESDIEQNYLVKVKADAGKIGEEVRNPYAGMHLLTQITSPDYIDRTLNGISEDDFGGYTKFGYEKWYGENAPNGNGYYKWRIPYHAALYQRNALSSSMDDVGQVMLGEKEVYYLNFIETKTHVAIFETFDRNGIRPDGTGAFSGAGTNALERDAQVLGDMLIDNGTITNMHKSMSHLKKLSKIKLYTKSDLTWDSENNIYRVKRDPVTNQLEAPIKTVNFQYSQLLCKGIPNSVFPDQGKLTLERIWFEYNGISKSTISPYTFEYEYPFGTGEGYSDKAVYPFKYSSIADDMRKFSRIAQNPEYSPFMVDGWGNYQTGIDSKKGDSRYRLMKSWVEQNPDPINFDPAAWHLKVIKLPTGGEIHVQYEQDDYAWVQNQPAHIMMPLLQVAGSGEDTFYLDTETIGLTPADYPNLVKMITNRYKSPSEGDRKKIYFKFLYMLLGNEAPGIDRCNSEYIDGYADVRDVGIDESGRVFLKLGQGEHDLPVDVCKDFVITQKAGNLSAEGNCDPSATGISNNATAKALVMQLLNMAKVLKVPNSICNRMNPELSYLRVPMPTHKKGGGVRVKRLLTYNKGYNDETSSLYGHEYYYKSYDEKLGIWRSSGVAVNEPSAFREENILVDFIARKNQSFISKVIAGVDKEQAEGPLGESVYPGPSVGYSQVIIQNIHTGKTNEGFSVREFYTAKEFPVLEDRTSLKTDREHLLLPLGLFSRFKNNVRAVQGFVIVLNNMHGQIRRSASYEGLTLNGIIPENKKLVTEESYEYYKPGEQIPVAKSTAGVEMMYPGKEVDVTMAHRAIKDHTNDFNVEVDLSFASFAIPVPFPNGIPAITKAESEYYTHATTKVVRYPAVLKKVESYKDGINHVQEHLAFDFNTGKPVATKSYDEYQGTYVAYNHPASWEYANLQQKASNQGLIFASPATPMSYNASEDAIIINFDTDATEAMCADILSFSTGDLLKVKLSKTTNPLYFHINKIDYSYNRLYLLSSMLNPSAPAGADAVEKVQIIRSGRTNQLSTQVASTIFHAVEDSYKLPELNASDQWNTTDAFAVALGLALKGKSGKGSVTISGGDNGFVGVNISQFKLPDHINCTFDAARANIKDVELAYEQQGDQMHIRLVSLYVKCGNSSSFEKIN
jgi:hypothetical protein